MSSVFIPGMQVSLVWSMGEHLTDTEGVQVARSHTSTEVDSQHSKTKAPTLLSGRPSFQNHIQSCSSFLQIDSTPVLWDPEKHSREQSQPSHTHSLGCLKGAWRSTLATTSLHHGQLQQGTPFPHAWPTGAKSDRRWK
jgi:hypothetical protein